MGSHCDHWWYGELYKTSSQLLLRIRPYIAESTGSRPISKVKLLMARLVLWWETTWESLVLYFFCVLPTVCWFLGRLPCFDALTPWRLDCVNFLFSPPSPFPTPLGLPGSLYRCFLWWSVWLVWMKKKCQVQANPFPSTFWSTHTQVKCELLQYLLQRLYFIYYFTYYSTYSMKTYKPTTTEIPFPSTFWPTFQITSPNSPVSFNSLQHSQNIVSFNFPPHTYKTHKSQKSRFLQLSSPTVKCSKNKSKEQGLNLSRS